jgi:hypothetical protein
MLNPFQFDCHIVCLWQSSPTHTHTIQTNTHYEPRSRNKQSEQLKANHVRKIRFIYNHSDKINYAVDGKGALTLLLSVEINLVGVAATQSARGADSQTPPFQGAGLNHATNGALYVEKFCV